MTYQAFDDATVRLHHNAAAASRDASHQAICEPVLPAALCNEAVATIQGWEGYAPTPLDALNGLAGDLGLGGIYYKDEGGRFGLGSFKALGGSYAVLCLLAQEIARRTGQSVSTDDIVSGRFAAEAAGITVVTATDGNHGRSVAWGAQRFGCRCRIYMHAGVSEGRARAVEDLGAIVVRVAGNYDASLEAVARDAAANGWFIVSDTSWKGYRDVPRHVMAGYTVMMDEIAAQLPRGIAPSHVPSHVFVQGGVGGLAAAVCADLWRRYGDKRPRFVIVEPDRAACLFESARAGAPRTVDITQETVMAGLSCGEVSVLAWDILEAGTDDFMVSSDDLVAPAMRIMAADPGCGPVVAGESAVAGLAGLIAAARRPDLAGALGLDTSSQVLLFGTEGATDPAIYRELVGRAPDDVLAA
ncbi:MAG: diaminopropionate ammonia-lyase [Alphaproteobacteria bacterium]